MRDSFIFYRSFYEAIKDLPRDIQGDVYTAIMEYSLNGITTESLKPVARSIFTLIKPVLDTNNQRFENGRKGGRPVKDKTKPKPNGNQTETNIEPNKDKDVDVDNTITIPDGIDDSVVVENDNAITQATRPNAGARARKTRKEMPPVEPTVVDLRTYTVSGNEWRTNFDSYLTTLRQCYMALMKNAEWIAERKRLNPRVDVPLTLEKACVEFWATEAGWKHKKKEKSQTIDWRATLTNSINQKFNKVYEDDTRSNQSNKGAVGDEFRAEILRGIGAI